MNNNRTEVRKTVDKAGNESVSYEKSWEKNGIHHRREVKKVEGGYIIRESRYGTPKDVEDAEYIDESREYVSTINPFEKKEDKSDDQRMFDFIDKPELI
jgi:hypothetical protein